jgi:hypothetical protein
MIYISRRWYNTHILLSSITHRSVCSVVRYIRWIRMNSCPEHVLKYVDQYTKMSNALFLPIYMQCLTGKMLHPDQSWYYSVTLCVFYSIKAPNTIIVVSCNIYVRNKHSVEAEYFGIPYSTKGSVWHLHPASYCPIAGLIYPIVHHYDSR